MKLISRLPWDRYQAGTLELLADDGAVLLVTRCRGEADNRNAAQKDNIVEDPTRVGGDHPAGSYNVIRIIAPEPAQFETYGPHFLVLQSVSGEALIATQNGRTGMGIHGGRLHPDGRLRETFGCLRVDNTALRELVSQIATVLPLSYECQIQ